MTDAVKTVKDSKARGTTARTSKPEPGPKPLSLVVENSLKCQTAADGEISISLLIPYPKMKVFMAIEELELPEKEMLDYVLDNVMREDDADLLKGLQDGADTIKFTMAWLMAVTERLGGAEGKSGPSSN